MITPSSPGAQVDQETIYAPATATIDFCLDSRVAFWSRGSLNEYELAAGLYPPIPAIRWLTHARLQPNSMFDVCQMRFALIYGAYLNILRSFL